MQHLAKDLITLVLIDDPDKKAAFEKQLGLTQDQAVDELIEKTDWSMDFPHLKGGIGSPAERLAALRTTFEAAGFSN